MVALPGGLVYRLLAEVQLLQGEAAATRASVERVLSMPGIENNARIRCWATGGLALVQLVAGEPDAARQTVAPPPPADVGLELTLRWLLVQCIVALAGSRRAEAETAASAITALAAQKSGQYALPIVQQLMAHPGRPAMDLVRLLLITNSR